MWNRTACTCSRLGGSSAMVAPNLLANSSARAMRRRLHDRAFPDAQTGGLALRRPRRAEARLGAVRRAIDVDGWRWRDPRRSLVVYGERRADPACSARARTRRK